MLVLVACEFSGRVRDAFRALGHDAYSVDLRRTITVDKRYHIIGDALEAIEQVKPELLIAHPPCTYLANSGASWLYTVPGRMQQMRDGVEFLLALLNADVPRVCVENPKLHGWAQRRIRVKPTQVIEPWQFGHGDTKRTNLWLRGLPPLVPTNIVRGRMSRTDTIGGRGKEQRRSITYAGIAKAMADQWGGLISSDSLLAVPSHIPGANPLPFSEVIARPKGAAEGG